MTKSSTHLPHFLQSRNMTHSFSKMVAKATSCFFMGSHISKYIVFGPWTHLSVCSLLQCYTIFRERSKFWKSQNLQQIVSIINQTPMAGGNNWFYTYSIFYSYDLCSSNWIVCIPYIASFHNEEQSLPMNLQALLHSLELLESKMITWHVDIT